jgi:hypothetical protein
MFVSAVLVLMIEDLPMISILRQTALAALVTVSASNAFAETFNDSAFGLSVESSDGWTGGQLVPDRADAIFGFNVRSGFPPTIGKSAYLCTVTFNAASRNAELTQDEINTMIASDEWQSMTKESLASALILDGATPFTVQGVQGVEYSGMPTTGPDAENVRVYVTILETPKGRTTQSCATTRSAFYDALALFRELRDGIAPPR